MLPEQDRIRMRHMLDACRQAREFAHGRARSDLDRNTMLSFAVVRAIEIIGEAAAKVTPEGRDSCPGLPWPDIVGMRNRLIHAYFDVNLDHVWTTLTDDLPFLESELARILVPSDSGPPSDGLGG